MRTLTRRMESCAVLTLIVIMLAGFVCAETNEIPLPEHPRPDLERPDWLNLNGVWEFQFDPADRGVAEGWFRESEGFRARIQVPFPWGSPLSGVDDEADIAWYARSIKVPAAWEGERVFLVVGASDWRTQIWLDGRHLGSHQGGYTPFEVELTDYSEPGTEQRLVIRVDDSAHEFKLEGKQGYGPARGIWQTIYLESRGTAPIRSVQFFPDISNQSVEVRALLLEPAPTDLDLRLEIGAGPQEVGISRSVPEGTREFSFSVSLPSPRLWSLEDPFLYEARFTTSGPGLAADQLQSYFGMREIGVVSLPGHGYPYISLNGKPVYLQLTLDQAYHPDGFYTFPSDAFMRDEILRAKKIGLNGIRIHVKIGIPRKLYWADRLGVLVMSDVPNSWGAPTAEMRRETEHALRGMLERDFNHPSIFSWVLFNETWGLRNAERIYTPEAQNWVVKMYRLAKSLDPTRLVEDNSANRRDHLVTDINSWHAYLPGYEWAKYLDDVSKQTYPGSPWNFAAGHVQGEQPMLNSECGNVWGYEGSAGDIDWSWDYHIMMNEFRRHPKVAGWLYTEHHDVINEWNGYYRYDRSEKETGLGDLVDGMSLLDLHSPVYVSTGSELCRDLAPGESARVPLWLSIVDDGSRLGSRLRLEFELVGWDDLGILKRYAVSNREVVIKPWMSEELEPLQIRMPSKPALAVLRIVVRDDTGRIVHRNFTAFRVASAGSLARDEIREIEGRRLRILRIDPKSFSAAHWSLGQWNVLDGLKVNGAGAGFFEFQIPWPEDLELREIRHASVLAELSAKQLLGKDRPEREKIEGNFMRGKGTHDGTVNPNAYPMTDEKKFPSLVQIRVNGISLGEYFLEDDPADHRGILSWHSQLRDRHLREAGSFGYLIAAGIPLHALESAQKAGRFVVRFEVDSATAGGLAIYGARFGRYLLDPSLSLALR